MVDCICGCGELNNVVEVVGLDFILCFKTWCSGVNTQFACEMFVVLFLSFGIVEFLAFGE